MGERWLPFLTFECLRDDCDDISVEAGFVRVKLRLSELDTLLTTAYTEVESAPIAACGHKSRIATQCRLVSLFCVLLQAEPLLEEVQLI